MGGRYDLYDHQDGVLGVEALRCSADCTQANLRQGRTRKLTPGFSGHTGHRNRQGSESLLSCSGIRSMGPDPEPKLRGLHRSMNSFRC